MDSFEFILYALVGLSLVIRPFLKKGKESRGLFETEDVPAPEVSSVPTTSWEDLMKELSLLDFEDLLLKTYELFSTNIDILEKYLLRKRVKS